MPKPTQPRPKAPTDLSRSYVALAERTTQSLTEIARRPAVTGEDVQLIRAALIALSNLRDAQARAEQEETPDDEIDFHALRDQIGCRLDRLRACCRAGEFSETPDPS